MPRGLDLLGALGTVGGRAAAGGAEGLLEGEILKRKFSSEDALNQLRQLDLILRGQQIAQGNAPTAMSVGRNVVTIDRRTGLPIHTYQPPLDPTDVALKDAQTRAAEARAEAANARAEAGGRQTDSGRHLASVEASLGRPLTVPERLQALTDYTKATTHQAAPAESIKPVIHQWDDDAGRRHESVTTFNTTSGRWDTQVRTIGAGKGKAPEKPTDSAKALQDYMTANAIPDTPTGRAHARQAMSTDKTDSAMDLFERRERVKEQIKEAAEQRKAEAKEKTSEDKRTGTLGDIQRMRQLAGEINKAGLMPPPGTTGLGMWWATKKRDWWDPGNPALTAFRGLFGPIMIGEIDRGIFDEKGVRAIQAFRANFDMLERIPPYESVNRFLQEIEGSIHSKMKSSGAGPAAAPTGGVVRWGRDASGKPVRLP